MKTLTRCSLPDAFASEGECRRLRHEDLAELSPAELWAEERLLETDLANRLFYRQRPRLMPCGELIGNPLLSDQEWLEQRLRRLSVERRVRLHV